MLTIAEQVDTLFKTKKKPNNREYSYGEVARALDGDLEASYIAKLRRGEIKSPGRDKLLALCRFFRVKADYFFQELEELPAVPEPPDVEPKRQLRVALRSLGIPEKQQELVENLIDTLRRP